MQAYKHTLEFRNIYEQTSKEIVKKKIRIHTHIVTSYLSFKMTDYFNKLVIYSVLQSIFEHWEASFFLKFR